MAADGPDAVDWISIPMTVLSLMMSPVILV